MCFSARHSNLFQLMPPKHTQRKKGEAKKKNEYYPNT